MNNYSIQYEHYTWVVVNNNTNERVVCFPTQIGAANWIKSNTNK